jgi:hypothetical protein
MARITAGSGYRLPRLRLLTECCDSVIASGKAEPAAALCMAELCRLHIHELRAAEQDAVAFLADQLADCLRGEAPMRFFALMLEQLDGSNQEWSRGEVRRLQVLLAARAFEHGLTVEDLVELGRVVPIARTVLGLEDRARWDQLELLWWVRRSRAWEKAGTAINVFELADTGRQAEGTLEEQPQLLLAVRPQELHVTSRGIWALGQHLTRRPVESEIMWEWSAAEKTYAIEVGEFKLRIARKPRDFIIELKAWLRFYFDDFLPRLPAARKAAKDGAAKPWQALRTNCPACGKALVPCQGDVGMAVG